MTDENIYAAQEGTFAPEVVQILQNTPTLQEIWAKQKGRIAKDRHDALVAQQRTLSKSAPKLKLKAGPAA